LIGTKITGEDRVKYWMWLVTWMFQQDRTGGTEEVSPSRRLLTKVNEISRTDTSATFLFINIWYANWIALRYLVNGNVNFF
jgi:hypothetical protein